jgi:hypothetical protein
MSITAPTNRAYARLGPAPRHPDRQAAIDYHQRIVDELQADAARPADDPERLTHTERTNLLRVEKRWRARAAGTDRRWLLVGTRSGRIARDLETATRPTPPGKTEWEDA